MTSRSREACKTHMYSFQCICIQNIIDLSLIVTVSWEWETDLIMKMWRKSLDLEDEVKVRWKLPSIKTVGGVILKSYVIILQEYTPKNKFIPKTANIDKKYAHLLSMYKQSENLAKWKLPRIKTVGVIIGISIYPKWDGLIDGQG